MDWAQILVIMLAVLFAVFMTVAIVLAVLLVRVTRQIKSATESAQRTVQAIEGSVGAFGKAALPLAVARGIVSQVAKRSSRKQKDSKK